MIGKVSVVVLVAAAAVMLKHSMTPTRTHKPYPYRAMRTLFTDDEADKLLRYVESVGVFPTTSRDQTSPVDHIGEATPMPADGKCPHRLMVANKNGTHCILPSRLDVASHYLKTGGRASFKERSSRLISRMLSFPKFFISDLSALEGIRDTIFNSSEYLDAQSEVCEGRDFIDPFQLGVILQVPGQQVPTHFDAPWFWGASRMSLPQYLLVAMEQSKLWESRRVHQIQGVAYVHDWPNAAALPDGEINKQYGGGFFFYPEGPGGRVEVFEARRSAAIMLDGSVMVHGTEPFGRSDSPDVPTISKDAYSELRHVGNGDWELRSDDAVLAKYRTQDLRISLVWRSRCFKSAEEKRAYDEHPYDLTVDKVLDTFLQDLRKRGRLGPEDPAPEPLDFAVLLLDEYVKYPLGKGVYPLNYCVVMEVLPTWLHPLLSWAC